MKCKQEGNKGGFDTILKPDMTRLEEKNKEQIKEQILKSTTRHANVYVVNSWGSTISEVTLRHRYRNSPEYEQKKTWKSIDFGQRSESELDVIYYTGPFTGFDYWWIQFTDSEGQIWECKDNFYCYLTAADDGTSVYCFLNGADEDMEIQMNSGGCYVSLWKK